ncbi:unnamed protein product [Arabis nemorensis]|uniref:FAD/NAD(P)-binding domain-containing protein n=1 Tax=Arabis nemorensis TaxID=586526 RepID=A0A565CMQ7_9BRAS|nr:unnamed protein product [Arabis nemorensis]
MLYVTNAIANNGGYTGITENETAPRTYTWPDNNRPRVCILGGGFGGFYTALRLESLVWPDDKKPQVVLVDQSERFVFKPMLIQCQIDGSWKESDPTSGLDSSVIKEEGQCFKG